MKFNWKLVLMLILLNGMAIGLTALLLPGITVAHQRLSTYLILGAMFGLLNAFVKPIVQFLTISLLFVTYGLVIIIVNTVMFLLLEFFLSDLLIINNIWWSIIGGSVISLLGVFLENLCGLSPPIIDDIAQPEPALIAAKPPAGRYDQIMTQVRELKEEVLGHENQQ
ncbi:MAG: phage holin family protein [Anaerolineae bacterium]|nr:phage holin family protein [Anaerolineae bacterium]